MRPKDPLPRQETSGVFFRIWCSCGQSNYVGETGRLLRTRIVENAAAVRRGDYSSLVAAHSTGPGHIFKFQEAEILARGDNRVSRELLESWFSGPQSIRKRNDLLAEIFLGQGNLSRGEGAGESKGPERDEEEEGEKEEEEKKEEEEEEEEEEENLTATTKTFLTRYLCRTLLSVIR
nr:unnamed protein product [Spirometra erinaceieuropaei]